MKKEPGQKPEFLKELELEAPELASLAVERHPELLSPVDAPALGQKRLIAEVSELPLRYAPFFDALATLWDLAEADVRAELERARDSAEWHWSALPGIRLFDVRGGARTQGKHARLVRFAPGIRFPAHRHKGDEKVFLLEGRYTDSDNTVYRSGDLHEMSEGTEHGFVVSDDEPCIAAVVEVGREFRSLFLRALAKLVRDG
jgi:quercetin dioxygenase-like cupin family protein